MNGRILSENFQEINEELLTRSQSFYITKHEARNSIQVLKTHVVEQENGRLNTWNEDVFPQVQKIVENSEELRRHFSALGFLEMNTDKVFPDQQWRQVIDAAENISITDQEMNYIGVETDSIEDNEEVLENVLQEMDTGDILNNYNRFSRMVPVLKDYAEKPPEELVSQEREIEYQYKLEDLAAIYSSTLDYHLRADKLRAETAIPREDLFDEVPLEFTFYSLKNSDQIKFETYENDESGDQDLVDTGIQSYLPFRTLKENYEREGDIENVNAYIHRADEFVDVYLQDDGPGIPDEQVEDLFEMPEDYRKGGFGFPMAERVVRNWGGEIEHVEEVPEFVEDEYQLDGATFRIRMPYAD